MDMNVTNEKLNFLHSLLDKELNSIEQESNKKDKQQKNLSSLNINNKSNQETDSEASISFTHSTNNNSPKSQKDDAEIDFKLRDIESNSANQSNAKQTLSTYEQTIKIDTQSKLMESELMDLQSKINNLEKKIVDINSPEQEKHLNQKKQKKQKEKDFQQESFDDEETTPMVRKYTDDKNYQDNKDSQLIKNNEIEQSLDNNDKQQSRHNKKKTNQQQKVTNITNIDYRSCPNKENLSPRINQISSNQSGLNYKKSGCKQASKEKRSNKFQLEKQIEEVEAQLNSSKTNLKISSSRKNIKTSSSTTKQQIIPGRGKCLRRDNSLNSTSGLQNFGEIAMLNKQLTKYKKILDEYKSAILRERQANSKLQEENENLKKEIKKKQIQYEKNCNYEQDFVRLTQNFEKSEFIRAQQKQLIQNLKNELDVYKLQKENQRYQSSQVELDNGNQIIKSKLENKNDNNKKNKKKQQNQENNSYQ